MAPTTFQIASGGGVERPLQRQSAIFWALCGWGAVVLAVSGNPAGDVPASDWAAVSNNPAGDVPASDWALRDEARATVATHVLVLLVGVNRDDDYPHVSTEKLQGLLAASMSARSVARRVDALISFTVACPL